MACQRMRFSVSSSAASASSKFNASDFSAQYRAAVAALGSSADAEDVAQDAFLTAYRRLDSFRGDASFKTWLLTITWHQAINRRRTSLWRRITRTKRDEGEESRLDGIAAEGQTPEELASGDQLRMAIRQAIQGLSPKLRHSLLLACSGEHTYQEISVMLKAPVGTIKWRVSEARRLIRKELRQR